MALLSTLAKLLLALLPATPPQAPAKPMPFAYVAPRPQGGQLRGAIELGANGLNSFIVRIDQQQRWQLEKAEYGRSYVLSNMADTASTTRQVKQLLARQLAYGVPRQQVRVLISSGAAQAGITSQLAEALRAAGLAPVLLSPAQEAAADLATALPAPFAGRAFVVDIGSGNTKLSWSLPGGQVGTAVTYGSHYYTSRSVREAEVLAKVREQARQVPAGQRQLCFVLGGAPYELAQATRPAAGARYTALPLSARQPAPAAGAPRAAWLLCRAIAEATGCQQFVFDRDANFTIGYLLAHQ